ncbi:hypothetical protein ACGYK5_15935 [Sulfitobacter sp. 1A16787]|uniref:hypothetical protein n=1 Tax=Sulfitobacter sp. 1A16787 TaxID=3368571 RepID=UPI0037459FE5
MSKEKVLLSTRIFQFFFAVAYIFFILSSTMLVRESNTFSLLIFLFRSGALIVILAFWLLSITHTSHASRVTIGFAALFSPYLFSEASLAYLDVLVLLVLASNFGKAPSTENYYVRLAYISVGLVLLIGLLAWVSIIPTKTFTWDGRAKDAMGFSNPNTFYFFLTSSAVVFFLFKRRVSFLLVGVAIIGLFPAVGSRTFLLTYALMVIFWIWPPILRYRLVIALLWLWLAAVILFGLTTVLFPSVITNYLNAAIGMDVNELTSNRLGLLANSRLSSIFQIVFGGESNELDSLFGYFMNSFGILGVVIFLYITLTGARRHLRSGRPIILAFTAIFFTTGLAEVPFDGSALVALVFMSSVVFGSALRIEKSTKARSI